MDRKILEYFGEITQEERAILDGRTDIDREIYMQGPSNIVNAKKLLAAGKLITIRPHTRFVHFPEHTHDYVEIVYMCTGQTTHIVNGKRIELKQGDLLFLGQRATHEICRANESDVAVNFIVLPDFFTATLTVLGEHETPLRRFLVDCLCGEDVGGGYLHLNVAGITAIQNLVENLLLTILNQPNHRRKISEMTMALLFLQLAEHTDTLLNVEQEDETILRVLRYVESQYVTGSFGELTEQMHYAPSWLSREIKRKTGKTYTQLVQERRLAQAAFMLKNTDRNVDDIAISVGYENISYFHRIFADTYGKSPRQYRLQERTLF